MSRFQQAEKRGRRAETLASLILLLKGYGILERRWKCPLGEIDLIARRGKRICFVEVKARKTEDAAQYAVTPQNRRRISQAANLWFHHAGLKDVECRFDVIAVTGWRVSHIKGAWHDDLA